MRTVAAASLFLSFACSASMRPIPDDVEPVPQTAVGSAHKLADAGMIALADAAPHVTLAVHDQESNACMDPRHHALRARQLGSDRWVISRAILDVVRNERKAQIMEQTDQLGNITGATLENVSDSCLAVIGFQNGDFVRSINGYAADWTTWAQTYQSIVKDGNAVVRFDRGGHALTVVYEIRNE